MSIKNVLYISPSITVKGGISSLLICYLKSVLAVKYNLITVYSHRSGNKITKLIQAISGLITVCCSLVFRKIDIVHFHGGGCISALRKLVYFRLVKLSGCRTIFHLHGGAFPQQFKKLSPIYKHLIIRMFEQADVVICLSDFFRKEILAIAPRTTVKVLMNSVILPDQMHRHDQKHEVKIVFLGLINEKKGIYDLLRVMKKVCEENGSTRLVIGGVGEVLRLHNEITELGITGYIDYLGWLKPEERDNLLSTADIFVLPSYEEGMPMAILEAMSFGIPVLSTRVGGIPEIVIDGVTGFLVDAGNLEQLFEKLSVLIRDDTCRRIFGTNGRKLIEDKHNIQDRIREIDFLYTTLLR